MEWLVSCMMLRQDTERCLYPCHPLGETELRLLNSPKAWDKLPLKIKQLNSLSYFKQAVTHTSPYRETSGGIQLRPSI